MFYQNRSLTSLIPTLGLFLGAAFRILPSFNRIMNSFQGFKFSMPGVKKVYFELKTAKKDFIKKPKTSEKILLKKEISMMLPTGYPLTVTGVPLTTPSTSS